MYYLLKNLFDYKHTYYKDFLQCYHISHKWMLHIIWRKIWLYMFYSDKSYEEKYTYTYCQANYHGHLLFHFTFTYQIFWKIHLKWLNHLPVSCHIRNWFTAGQKIGKSPGKKKKNSWNQINQFFFREIAFLAVSNIFLGQKLIFGHFWNSKKWNLVLKNSWNRFHEFFFDQIPFFAISKMSKINSWSRTKFKTAKNAISRKKNWFI